MIGLEENGKLDGQMIGRMIELKRVGNQSVEPEEKGSLGLKLEVRRRLEKTRRPFKKNRMVAMALGLATLHMGE